MPIPDDDIDGIDGIDVDVDDLDADLLLALADEEQAPSGVLQALLTAVAGPWWAPFVRRAAGLLDLDTATTRDLFVGIADGDRWMPGPGDGIDLFHIDGGPAVAGAITGFVRLAPGATFPHHRHMGFQDVLVLQGSFFHAGTEIHAGMEAPMPPSSSHENRAGVGGCVYLAVSRDGLAFDGEEPIGPDDPRA